MRTNEEMGSTQIYDLREWWVLSILLGSAFVLRLYLVFHTYIINNDGILYVELAKLISQGCVSRTNSLYLHPYLFNVYPLLISVFQKIFYNWEFSAKLVSALFGSLTIIPFYFLVKCLFNRSVALISSILFIFHPYLVRYSAEVIRGPTFWLFFTMTLWVGWLAITREKPWLFALTGLFGAISFLSRREGIFILPLITVWLFLEDVKALKGAYKKKVLFAFTLLVGFAMLSSPAMLYLKKKTGRWHWARLDEVPSAAFGDVTMKSIKGNFEKLELKPWDNSLSEKVELTRLKNFLTLAVDNRMIIIGIEAVRKFLKATHPLLFLLLVFGTIKRKKVDYHKREELFLLLVVLILFLIFVRYGTFYIHMTTRQMMAPVILSLAWVGTGVLELDHRIRNTIRLANSTGIRVALFRHLRWVLLGSIVFILLPKTLASQRFEKVPLKEAGIWMREHGPTNPVVMVQGKMRRIVFYANGVFLEIPRNEDLLEFVKKNHVDFLAINEKDIEKSNPGLIHSLDPEYFNEEVVVGKSSERYVIRIYAVKY